MTYDVCGPCGIDIRPGSYAECTFSMTPPSSTATTSIVSSPTIVELETQTLRHPDYPEYAIESARLRSFGDWPKTLNQKPKQLSDAGFFHAHKKGDRVICFSCGGGLRDWDENDDPWEQHALWFSKCEYLQLVKGQEFIDRVKANQAKVDEENNCGSSLQESGASTASASAAAQVVELMAQNEDPHENKLCDSRLCKICCCSEYNTAFFPCGHVVACAKCASSITKCPLCRKPLEKVMRVFFS